MKKYFYYLFFISVSFLSCNKDADDAIKKDLTKDFALNDFVWKGLNNFYLWQDEVPNLADNRFESSLVKTNASSKKYVEFLSKFSTPRDIFNHLLHSEDRFSFIVEDYRELEKSFQGISLSNGMNLGFARIRPNSTHIAAYVQYVIPNSDAEKQGVKRGDLILQADNTPLTIDNYRMLFSDSPSVLLDFYTFDGQDFQHKSKKQIKKEVLQENPILLHKTFTYEGKKIAYLMYNSFVSEYDKRLNDVFGKFKSENVEELILDLRYNGGGSVQTSQYLASMITGDFTDKLYIKQRSNKKLEAYLPNTEIKFVNQMSDKTPINSLHLSRVYIIAGNQTASASELIINGLAPYIAVTHIGQKTIGKNTASITVKDYIDEKGTVNPAHHWAMQPLILRSENARQFGAYENGLSPNIEIHEIPMDLGVLGENSDPLFAKTLEAIRGNVLAPLVKYSNTLQPFDYSKNHSLTSNMMYVERKLNIPPAHPSKREFL